MNQSPTPQDSLLQRRIYGTLGLSVLVGTALMGLIFFSNRSGHDDDAGGRHDR